MNQTIKLILFIITGMLVISCQQDDTSLRQEVNNGPVSRYITLEDMKTMPGAMEKYNEMVNLRRPKSTIYDSERGFHIYTDSILLMEYGNKQSLTFLVMRDTVSSIVENIVLNKETCGYYKAYKTEYRLTQGDKDKIIAGQSINLEGKADIKWFRGFDSDNLMKSGGSPEVIMMGDRCYVVTYIRAQSYSEIDGQIEASKWIPVYTEVMCPEEEADYSFNEDGHSGGGSAGTYGPDFDHHIEGPITWQPGVISGTPLDFQGYTPFQPVMTKPVLLEALVKSDCDKIADALANAALKQKILELATKVNDQVNEHGLTMDKDNVITDITPGPFLSPNLNPTEKYTVFSHIHNDHPDGTYSVFSYVDLRTISIILHNNKIHTGKFIATLSTSKGTHYVLVISSVFAFKNFFYYFNNDAGPGNMELYLDSWNKAAPLEKEYFTNTVTLPKIQQTDVNNQNVLSEFLNFLKDASMGVTLYEADPTFTNFKKLSKDSNNNIVKEDCD